MANPPNNLTSFTFYPACAVDPILNTSLIYENTSRLACMGSDYFSLVNPWYHAPVIPLETGYHMYSYALDFFCLDPMGSTNYGKLTNVSIVPQASASAIAAANGIAGQSTSLNGCAFPEKFSFVTTAVNYNIIRISGGALGLKCRKTKTGRRYVSCGSTLVDKRCNIHLAILASI